jgi:transcriptional regulator with XRE-family HTH domain
MHIGQAIKTVRQTLGVSQRKLSEMIVVSPTSLSQIERGIKRPSPKTLKSISDKLNVPEAVFYVLGLDEKDVSPAKKQLFKHIFPAVQGLMLELVGEEHAVLFNQK